MSRLKRLFPAGPRDKPASTILIEDRDGSAEAKSIDCNPICKANALGKSNDKLAAAEHDEVLYKTTWNP